MISKRLMKDEKPVWPKRAVITGGMPYGNKSLHFGHVGGMFIHADIFARFLRDRIGKENVIFVSGTDCYGSPILESYRKLKEDGYQGTIEEYVEQNHNIQKKTLNNYEISLDLFGASALGKAGKIHKEFSEEIFETLFKNGYIEKLSTPQFFDEELGVFLNGRQVVGRCPIEGCTSEHAYADECSLGHQYMPSELIHPISVLSGKQPIFREVTNWYFCLEDCIDRMSERIDYLKKCSNSRKYMLNTIEESLKKPMIHIPRKYIENLDELVKELPECQIIDEEKKPSVSFVFSFLEDREKAKKKLEELGIHFTAGKTLVPFRLSGNIEWGVPVPECEDQKNLTFWVWPESLWAPISFTKAYLESKGANSEEWITWWDHNEAMVYQFIGEDNIYFYAIAEMGLFTGLKIPKTEKPDMEKINLPHIIANRHVLFMDTKASSSSEVKPPMADELLEYYTPEQLRMHFMSLGLSSKSVGFKPQVYMPKDQQEGVDMVLKEGNLLTNVLNRLIRSCFYSIQANHNGRIPKGEVNEKIRSLSESVVAEYERHMYNHDFHRISYLLDDYIREINKYWVNHVRVADKEGNNELREQILVDCFYACKVMAILVHPIAPAGCEMFREYLNLDESFWDWTNILEPICYYVDDLSTHELKFLEPRIDFFQKHECQLNSEQE